MTARHELREKFLAIVHPSRPNEWDVDEVVNSLLLMEPAVCDAVLAHVQAVWPVSHSLCFTFLLESPRLTALVEPGQLSDWVRSLLTIYEQRGLSGARAFMDDVEGQFLAPLRGHAGVELQAISSLMTSYIRGVSGRPLELKPGEAPATNTTVIFLPPDIDVFQEKNDNFIFYKFLISAQWATISLRTYEDLMKEDLSLEQILGTYAESRLASLILYILLFGRSVAFLNRQLPGLMRQALPLCRRLLAAAQAAGGSSPKQQALYAILDDLLLAGNADTGAGRLPTLAEIFTALPETYDALSPLPGDFSTGAGQLLWGTYNFVEAEVEITSRRQGQKGRFVALLASLLATPEKPSGRDDRHDEIGPAQDSEAAAIMLMAAAKREPAEKTGGSLDNDRVELPSELRDLIRDIVDDLGQLPVSYVQAAQGIGGSGVNLAPPGKEGGEGSLDLHADTYLYDEWDFRRGGYRLAWCRLVERPLHPVRSDFVPLTLGKYRPELHRLRRQFEMLRSHSCFVRRQRYGDEIDLDAVVDALGDRHAGRAPSDRLFVRLLRNQRDISAMFLVDMSNSTEGWVGVAMKEALILLAEALEVVGDRYGIYGFSGMRRSRNNLYTIKALDEDYGELVQRRISAVAPMEYTRMGPPIRHLVEKLLRVQSRVRLLIVLSDGKPEDYDDYKGEYAIEDTRKALLEARGRGVYPFCITIDKNAQDYLEHMFGRGNYIFVNRVSQLPHRMTEMYRLLTS